MHEMSLAQELLERISEKCDNRPLLKAEFEIGSMSGVVPEAFSFCAETVFKDTFGEEIELVFNTIKAKARCICGNKYAIKEIFDPCPACGEFSREIIEGKDLSVRSIELGDEND